MYGVCAGIGCNFATQLKYFISADDALDIFAVHAVGGLIGNICTGLFAADYIAHLDGFTVIPGGWLNRHWIQLAIQLADSASGAAYSFFGSIIILSVLAFIGRFLPVFRLRVDAEEEEQGIDDVEIGEFAYDYVEILREVKPTEFDEYEADEIVDGHSQRSQSQTAMIRSPGLLTGGLSAEKEVFPMQTFHDRHQSYDVPPGMAS